MVPWVLALSSLADVGCGVQCGDISLSGSAFMTVALPPQSQVTPPETFVISSPVQATGTIDQFDQATPSHPGESTVWATVHQDASDARTLYIYWMFLDLDHNAPPGDQFVATVTDATGNVTGQSVETGIYRWMAADGCAPGHWVSEGLAY
jgi:hypothetical protein